MRRSQMLIADTEATAFGMLSRRRFIGVMLFLSSLLVIAVMLNINIGSVLISMGNITRAVWDGIRYSFANLFTNGGYEKELSSLIEASMENQILFRIRIPRTLLTIILGGGLSVSGYLLQVFFRNPIAGPFVLGISSGAKMLVAILLIFVVRMVNGISSYWMIAAAFVGSLIITCVVLLFSQKVRNVSMLIVVGIMVSYLCSAVTDFCITFASEFDVANLKNWSMGSFSGADWGDVQAGAIICFFCVLAVFLLSKPIGAYSLGEGYAKSLGIRIRRFRIVLILLSSLLSACVTALAGPVSFVGIAVPHITRILLKSSRPAYVVPAVFICGSVFCLFCDLIARTVLAPTELAIGTVTSVIGAPIVIYMMMKRRQTQET